MKIMNQPSAEKPVEPEPVVEVKKQSKNPLLNRVT
jgi:hypothetical protein